MRVRPNQRCRICGQLCAMTQEHLPPRAAGNNRPLRVRTLRSLVAGLKTGERYPSGLWRFSLCARCNSLWGAKYVPAFVRWTSQAAEYHARVKSDGAFLLPFAVQALSVAKEIAVILLAMSEPDSIDLPHFINLRRLVTHPKQHGRTPGFRFLTYFHRGPPVLEGVFAAIDTSGGPAPMVFCQVGVEPLGYIVTADNKQSIAWAQKHDLCDISYFFEQPHLVVRHDHLGLCSRTGEMPFRASR